MKNETQIENLLDLIIVNQGGTFNSDKSLFVAPHGYQVAMKGYEKPIEPTVQALNNYFNSLKELEVAKEDKIFFGFWLDSQDGVLYADLSVYIKDVNRALEFGLQEDQKAIWDWSNFAEIRLAQ